MDEGSPDLGAAARRRFLRQSVAAAMALGAGVTLRAFGGAGESGRDSRAGPRWGMLIDTARCATGCDACVRACNDEHGLSGQGRPETDAQWIRGVTIRHTVTGRVTTLPMLCQHCADPPCVDVCPTGASFRREDGVVLVDKHTCIGCRYCLLACPFKARSFVHEDVSGQRPHSPRGKGTVEGCTMCVHRIDAGRRPACVEACAADGGGAMLFGDLGDSGSAIAKRLAREPTTRLRADLRLDAGVYYQGL